MTDFELEYYWKELPEIVERIKAKDDEYFRIALERNDADDEELLGHLLRKIILDVGLAKIYEDMHGAKYCRDIAFSLAVQGMAATLDNIDTYLNCVSWNDDSADILEIAKKVRSDASHEAQGEKTNEI